MDYVPSSTKESILIIDDTPANLRLLANPLSERGYRVCFAPDAAFALESASVYLPNLILVQHRGVGAGWEVLQPLKADKRICQVPIIVVGTSADSMLKAQAFSAGAADYISCPFEVEELIARIENQLTVQHLQNQLIDQNFQLQQAVYQQQQVETALNQQLQRTRLLQYTTEAIRCQAESQQIFETIATQIGEILQVDRCSIHMYVPPPMPEMPLVAEYVRPEFGSLPELDLALADHPFIAGVLSCDQAIASPDVYTDARLQSFVSLCRVAKTQSLLTIRTSYRNQANGMILLQQCARQRAWTTDEITLIEATAAQVGIAIAQAKSIEQEQKQLEALEYQNLVLRQELQERKQIRTQTEIELLHKSTALSEFSNHLKQIHRLGLTDFETLEELCADYLKTGCEMLGFPNGLVGQISDGTYRLLAGHSNLDFLTPNLELELCKTYCQTVFDQQQTVCYTQISQIEALRRYHSPDLSIESYIGTPIWVDGTLYGTLCFFSAQARQQGYNRHEQEIIELMAQSIGKFFSMHRANAKQQQTEEEVQLLLNLTQLITAAPDFDQALGVALQALCQATGWIYGEVWLPSADGSVLECSPIWYCNQKNQTPAVIVAVKQLRQSVMGITFQPGEGIAGRVWSQQQPEWTLDENGLAEDGLAGDGLAEEPTWVSGDHFQYRFQLVNQYGIKARLGVPITVTSDRKLGHSGGQSASLQPQVGQSRVLAVLVFFTIEARQQDQRLIKLVSAVAAQLGTVLSQKQAEAELQTLFAAMNDVVLVRDATGRCLKVASTNPALQRPTASVLGKTLHETLPLGVADQILQSIRASLASQTTVNLEYSVPGFNREICLFASISPLSKETVLVVTRDITDRKQVEEALARRERYLAVIVEVQRELLTVADQKTQYRKVLRLLGQVSLASRVYLCEQQDAAGELAMIPRAEWCVDNFQSQHHSPALPIFLEQENRSRWLQTLAKGKIISGSVADFPESERSHLKAQQISSMLVLPLIVNGSLWGLIEFNHCRETRSWDALEISLLSAAATAIALHHERKLAENALRQSAEREQATLRVIERMRQTLDIKQIFRTTAEELRQLLKCDRVLIYRFNSDWSGEFVAESVLAGWLSVSQTAAQEMSQTETATEYENCAIRNWSSEVSQNPDLPDLTKGVYLTQDTYLQETQGGAYSRGVKYLCVQDIDQANLDPCYLELLRKLQSRAYLTVPIFQGNQLWGLLAAYQNSGPRDWQPSEIHLAIHISTQLGVALQQADLLTQTQRQSADLAKARDAAEAANRAKTQFLANMSHELRTPLNSILGFTQLIGLEAALKSEHQDYLQIINRSGQHLLDLINEVLEIAKLEADRASLQEISFDLYQLLRNIEEMLRLTAAEKRLKFSVLAAAEVPQQVIADRGKLRQVLLNLLDNAIKFTEAGSVTLRVQYSCSDQPYLHFAVEDTGFGIAPEEMDSLFEAFVQTEAGRQSNRGTGLGLSISYRFVHLMRGQLQVRSVPGAGSVFEFTIPVQVESELEQLVSMKQAEPDSPAHVMLSEHLGVHCIYETAPSPPASIRQDLVLAELAVMPKEWVTRLYQAAIGCSDRQVLQLIEQIPSTSSNLIHCLEELVYNFHFEEIVELTQSQQQ